MNVLVLGVTGTLGHILWHVFNKNNSYNVWGTLRNATGLTHFPTEAHSKLFINVDVLDFDQLIQVFEKSRPDVVINCIGLVKQLHSANDPLIVLPINSIFPHRLAQLCHLTNTRVIHISTDCVFSGKKGNYVEADLSDAEDLYGKSKFIGELSNTERAVTLRTSMIGHKVDVSYGLVDWFLSQTDTVKGYVNAIFSGLPTIELANLIRDYVIPNNNLSGIYHVAAKPINKFELLQLIAEVYSKQIKIEKDETLSIDRSLNATLFNEQTGYIPPEWPFLIEMMHQSKKYLGGL